MGELGVIQATQELKEGCPPLPDTSSSSLLAKGQSSVCLSVEALAGAQGIFPDKDIIANDVAPL